MAVTTSASTMAGISFQLDYGFRVDYEHVFTSSTDNLGDMNRGMSALRLLSFCRVRRCDPSWGEGTIKTAASLPFCFYPPPDFFSAIQPVRNLCERPATRQSSPLFSS